MISEAIHYEYPRNGQYNETVATLADGRVLTIDVQYKIVLPHGEHKADCDQINKMGGRCTCGLLDGIDVAALIVHARANGKFGRAPRPAPVSETIRESKGVCPHCGTYCHGDCRA